MQIISPRSSRWKPERFRHHPTLDFLPPPPSLFPQTLSSTSLQEVARCGVILSLCGWLGVRAACSATQSCLTFCDPMDCSPSHLLHSRHFPSKNTGEGCHFLLQGIFLTQGSNLGLLRYPAVQADSLPLSHWGSWGVRKEGKGQPGA